MFKKTRQNYKKQQNCLSFFINITFFVYQLNIRELGFFHNRVINNGNGCSDFSLWLLAIT